MNNHINKTSAAKIAFLCSSIAILYLTFRDSVYSAILHIAVSDQNLIFIFHPNLPSKPGCRLALP